MRARACRRTARPTRPCWSPGGRRPIETTRTSSPYFSPNSAMAPRRSASSSAIRRVSTGLFSSTIGVGQILDRGDLLRRHRLLVREVEAQALGRNERALLRDVRAEHLAQGLVQEMRRRVVGARRRAARVIDLKLDGVAGLEAALLDPADVHEQIAQLLLRVGDAEQRALGALDQHQCRRPGRRSRRRTASG